MTSPDRAPTVPQCAPGTVGNGSVRPCPVPLSIGGGTVTVTVPDHGATDDRSSVPFEGGPR